MPNFISKVSLPNDEKIYDLKSYKTQGIFYAQVDTTSTSTHFTVTIPELTATEYYDGLTLLLYNGKVTSASGFTINVNGLGAKPSYSNMTLGNPVTPTDPTRDTTIFNINYAMLFVYNSTIVSGGCWICYRGYDNNTNTIGYQVRTNSMRLPVSDQTGRYRLLFTSADDTHYVPANTSSATSATTAKTVNQRPIDPFGSIRYYGYTTVLSAGANVGAGYLWQQYVVTMGYSFSDGSVNLNTWDPVYLKCAPQANGSAIIDATDPYVQTLPTTDDGKIYIYLGVANAATTFELTLEHPIYYYKDGAIRVWTNPAATGSGLPTVTTADNDKVLKVVDGDWAVTNEDEIFKISVIAVVISQTEYSMTADKTYAKIVAALNANKVCQVCLNFAGPDSPAYDGGYYIFNYSGSNSGILNFIMDMPSTQPMSNPTFINGGTNMGMRLTCSTSDGQDTWKLSIFDYVLAPNEVVGNSTTPIYWDNGFQECSLATVASSGSYNDLSNKPTIPSAPGTLNTNNSTAQTVPTTAEALSGAINLHKIAKTGNYGDLQNAPAYNASTGNLSSTTFTGSGAGLTDIPVAELSNVVPLDKGGTGIDGGSDSWHDSDELHPRFVINYGAGFYVYWRGPLDNITSVNDFLASDYFRYAQRETHPILANGSTFIGSAVLFTGAFDSTPDPTRLYFVFPDAIYFNNQFVNGLSCTLVYNEGDGISASVSSMLPSVPKWATILSAVQTELLGKEVTDNKVTSVDSGSSDVQYPSAKLLYDIQQTLLGMLQDTDESKYNITGGEITGDVVLKSAAATDFPALIFQRGTLSDNYNDWRIQDRGGFLRFDQRGNGSTSWSEIASINTTGTITSAAFSGSGASLTSLNASNISSGTLADARLPSTVEKVANKVTSITSSSTDTEYPSAKAVYDTITPLTADPPVIADYAGPSGTGRFTTYLQNAAGDTYTHPYRLDPPNALMYRVGTDSIAAYNGIGTYRYKHGVAGGSWTNTGTSGFGGALIGTPIAINTTTFEPTNSIITSGATMSFRCYGIATYANGSQYCLDVDFTIKYSGSGSWSVSYDNKGDQNCAVALSLNTSQDSGKLSVVIGPAAKENILSAYMASFQAARYMVYSIDHLGSTLGYPTSTAAYTTLVETRSNWSLHSISLTSTDTWANILSTYYPNGIITGTTHIQSTTLSVISGTTTWGDIIDAHDAHKIIIYETQGTDTQLNRIYYLSSYSVTIMGTVVGGTLVFTSLGSVNYNNNVVAGYVELKWTLSSGTRNSLISFADATQTVVPLVNVDNVAY